MNTAISDNTITDNFERLMMAESDTTVKKAMCSEFADALIKHMG